MPNTLIIQCLVTGRSNVPYKLEPQWNWFHSIQYINEYGYTSDLNRCLGVQLLYLAGNKYSKNVDLTNSAVFKKELACKKYFRSDEVNAHLLGRGFERINLDRIKELFDIIEDTSNKGFEEIETQRRTSERLQQQDLKKTDKIEYIISHHTEGGKSRKLTRYLCHWNRPFILTEEKLKKKKAGGGFETETKKTTKDYTTYQMYKEIISVAGGSDAMNVYKAKYPNAKFRD